jgi:hypothetical protein
MKVRLIFPAHTFVFEVTHDIATNLLSDILPFESVVETWGDEVYFETPIAMSLDSDATDVVDKGTVCFWTQGNSIAIPFGPTPVSVTDECRLVAPVNILGAIEGELEKLSQVSSGDRVRVERVP